MTVYEGLPRAVPEDVGMSTSRLERIAPVMQRWVDDGKIPFVLTMIAREGRLVHFEKYGMQDVATAKPVGFDTIFRIYSMTKPITSIAVMMLYEEGHFQLSTPVSKFIPAFKDMQVYTENGEATVAAEREITIKHLLTHTAGFTYGFESDHPIAQRYEDIFFNVYHLVNEVDLAKEMEVLGEIPLFFQPGTRWHYGMSSEVVCCLIEAVSDMPLTEFLKTRIFNPLGMQDTDFSVPKENADRYATLYEPTEDGGIQRVQEVYGANGPLSFYHNGIGLQSTAADYLRFCQMLLNDGELDSVRLLGRKTVECIRANHLSDDCEIHPFLKPGCGFGLGFQVVTDVADTPALGSLGTYDWRGAAGTKFWIDPVEDLIGILMTQLWVLGVDPSVFSFSEFSDQFKVLTYQAITN